MPTEDKKRMLHRLLVERILRGPGQATAEQRVAAFDGAALDEPLSGLLRLTATESFRVIDADFVAVQDAGISDDRLFELVICAAIGASTRHYEAGLAALAEATAGTE